MLWMDGYRPMVSATPWQFLLQWTQSKVKNSQQITTLWLLIPWIWTAFFAFGSLTLPLYVSRWVSSTFDSLPLFPYQLIHCLLENYMYVPLPDLRIASLPQSHLCVFPTIQFTYYIGHDIFLSPLSRLQHCSALSLLSLYSSLKKLQILTAENQHVSLRCPPASCYHSYKGEKEQKDPQGPPGPTDPRGPPSSTSPPVTTLEQRGDSGWMWVVFLSTWLKLASHSRRTCGRASFAQLLVYYIQCGWFLIQ